MFQIQEWDYLDFWHTTEKISYMVVEEGTHELSDGTWIEAGKTFGGKKWQGVEFAAPFEKAPIVISQITTQS